LTPVVTSRELGVPGRNLPSVTGNERPAQHEISGGGAGSGRALWGVGARAPPIPSRSWSPSLPRTEGLQSTEPGWENGWLFPARSSSTSLGHPRCSVDFSVTDRQTTSGERWTPKTTASRRRGDGSADESSLESPSRDRHRAAGPPRIPGRAGVGRLRR